MNNCIKIINKSTLRENKKRVIGSETYHYSRTMRMFLTATFLHYFKKIKFELMRAIGYYEI